MSRLDLDPIAVFEREHQHALVELSKLESAVDELQRSDQVTSPLGAVRTALEFLTTTVRQHNENEEVALFPEIRDTAPCEPFVEEHRLLRELEQRLGEALVGADAATAVIGPALDIVNLLRGHIEREDTVLFPCARSALDPAALRRVAAGLE